MPNDPPWVPRTVPWMVYVAGLAVIAVVVPGHVWAYGPLKLVQTVLVCSLVFRWRRQVPELSLRFHWSVVPLSVVLVVTWVVLHSITAVGISFFGGEVLGGEASELAASTIWERLEQDRSWLFWSAAVAHLLAMCLAVPLIEEVFHRSLLLRGLHDFRSAATAACQLVVDLPLVGDLVARTGPGRRAIDAPPALTERFERTELGQLSGFGVAASTAIFMLAHQPADWLGAILCGVTWCLLLNRTRRLGLGPVIWSHALVNLMLWGYVMVTGDWRFL